MLKYLSISLILVIVGFGALYFTIQAIPDRLAAGTSKAQMQIVGILGLISLVTMNNAYWVAALLLAAIRIPDLVTPFMSVSRSLKKISNANWHQSPEIQLADVQHSSPVLEEIAEKGEPGDA